MTSSMEKREPKRPDAEEELLANALFGDASGAISMCGRESKFARESDQEVGDDCRTGAPQTDVSGHRNWSDDSGSDSDDEAAVAGAKANGSSTTTTKRKHRDILDSSAWVDSDDETQKIDVSATNRLRKLRRTEEETILSGAEYSRRLRAQFCKMNPATAWAALPKDGSRVSLKIASAVADDMTDGMAVDLFQSSKSMLRARGAGAFSLKREHLDVLRVKDANIEDRSESVVQALEFHPRRSLMLTAGLDKKLRLFDVDGKFNRKVQGVAFRDMPIRSAHFSGCVAGSVGAEEIVVTGRRPFFYTVDLGSAKVMKVPSIAGRDEKSWENMVSSPDGRWLAFLGNDGYIILVSGKSKRWVANLKMNGNVRAAAFSPNGEELITVGTEGDVYRWSLADRRCLHRHRDEGNMSATALAVSPNGKYYAVGSTAGVVNVYDAALAAQSDAPAPMKSIMNLTTPIDGLEWNHDSQILALRSHRLKDQFKLVHCPSFTTFQNWPTASTPLGYSTCQSFSPHSGFLALGNDKGKVLLYRLKHYTRI